MKTRVISDTHFDHRLLIDIGDREVGFEQRILKNLMKIPKGDTLIHIGDICIGNDGDLHEKYIKPLQCKKILVLGNHDGRSASWYMDHGWDFVCFSFNIKMFGKEIMFVHIPTPESTRWATETENRVVIHGHYHKWGREDRLKQINHILYSCEYEDMQPRTIEYMLNKK